MIIAELRVLFVLAALFGARANTIAANDAFEFRGLKLGLTLTMVQQSLPPDFFNVKSYYDIVFECNNGAQVPVQLSIPRFSPPTDKNVDHWPVDKWTEFNYGVTACAFFKTHPVTCCYLDAEGAEIGVVDTNVFARFYFVDRPQGKVLFRIVYTAPESSSEILKAAYLEKYGQPAQSSGGSVYPPGDISVTPQIVAMWYLANQTLAIRRGAFGRESCVADKNGRTHDCQSIAVTIFDNTTANELLEIEKLDKEFGEKEKREDREKALKKL